MEQERLSLFLVENALEMFLAFDRMGMITYANREAEKQLEYEGELCGISVVDIFPLFFRINEGSLCVEAGAFDTRQELMAYRKNRTCFPARAKLMRDGQNYVLMFYNTTSVQLLAKEASRAEEEAQAALQVKTEFVANVTHELRTPVNGILGNVQELLELESDRKKRNLLQLVERGCRDMNALINNILDFSKLEAGKFVLEPQEFSLRNMIEYVKGNHSNRITEKGLEFTVSVSPEIPENIVGDELRIVQILNNLISNAYKFTSVGSIHVEVVKTAQSGKRMELFFMVMDTGIGIAAADQDKLFKSFSQVDASISRKYGGTGLGLNITKQLVELMGGHIHVQSEPGRGSTFSFDIWVELPGAEDVDKESTLPEMGMGAGGTDVTRELLRKLQNLTENQDVDKLWQFGEPENLEELEKKLSKLILSVEMENWEKAEMFAETVKQLVETAPREIKSAALRLKMAVQKENYEKTLDAYDKLKELL